MIKELNKRRVLELIEAFYSGDVERALSLCSDDVDFFSNAPIDILPHLGHHRGKDDVRQMWQTVHQRYSSMRNEMPFIAAEDDKVAVHLRAFFAKRLNERIVQFDVAGFFTLRDGKIIKISRDHRHVRSDPAGGGAGLHLPDRSQSEGEHIRRT